jgi:hypothetical protein
MEYRMVRGTVEDMNMKTMDQVETLKQDVMES